MKKLRHKYILAIIGISFFIGLAFMYPGIEEQSDFWKGITVTAPDQPFQGNPMQAIKDVSANSIAVIPYGFIRPGNHKVEYDVKPWQWWGERPEGAKVTIAMAHQSGLKVMLKPQIYIPRSWIGSYLPESEEDWTTFIESYRAYILTFARIAEAQGADLFCVGTELKAVLNERTDWFESLIEEVRTVYSGSLVYAANWDEYQHIHFWDKLDYIGINAYFPFGKRESDYSWEPAKKEMQKASKKWDAPVLFTEYGYLSVPDCFTATWELENQIHDLTIDEECQKKALEKLWKAMGHEEWWAGGFLWKWFPEGMGHEGYVEKDYTPQGKKAEESLSQIFKEINR